LVAYFFSHVSSRLGKVLFLSEGYEAEATTSRRSGSPPTITGFPFSYGLSACSTEAKKASKSI